MEPAEKSMRARLILGKFPITKIENGMAHIYLGGTTTLAIQIPEFVDLRQGDLLTLYTEAPFKDAKLKGPSVQ